jgi:hypothetical protein
MDFDQLIDQAAQFERGESLLPLPNHYEDRIIYAVKGIRKWHSGRTHWLRPVNILSVILVLLSIWVAGGCLSYLYPDINV